MKIDDTDRVTLKIFMIMCKEEGPTWIYMYRCGINNETHESMISLHVCYNVIHYCISYIFYMICCEGHNWCGLFRKYYHSWWVYPQTEVYLHTSFSADNWYKTLSVKQPLNKKMLMCKILVNVISQTCTLAHLYIYKISCQSDYLSYILLLTREKLFHTSGIVQPSCW